MNLLNITKKVNDLPIYTNFLNFNTETLSLQPLPELFYELPFGPATATFLLISAVAHFYLATIGYRRYTRNLEQGMNPVRFYEYALSSSLMIVLIGMLARRKETEPSARSTLAPPEWKL